jgi:thiamine-phosphate pyrophosphorylase
LPGQGRAILRVIDANTNRAKERLRVCEEISRFVLNSPGLTLSLKRIRHRIGPLTARLAGRQSLFAARRAFCDAGKKIYVNELKRESLADIFFANIQRVKESVRVLEEFAKLRDKSAAVNFKKIRYEVYELEKKILPKISKVFA